MSVQLDIDVFTKGAKISFKYIWCDLLSDIISGT